MVSFSYLLFLRGASDARAPKKAWSTSASAHENWSFPTTTPLRYSIFEPNAVNSLACGLVLTYSRRNRGFVDGFGNVSIRIVHKGRQWLLKRNVCLLWFLCFIIHKRGNVIQSSARLSSRDFFPRFLSEMIFLCCNLLCHCDKLKLTWLSEFVYFSLNNYQWKP